MDALVRTLRYALRGLRNSPGFTAVAVITLALGIGVNATIFSMVSAVLYRPLPVEEPGRLVNVYGHSETSRSHDALSYPNYLDYREQATTLSGLAAHANFFANLSIGGSSELVVGEIVSDNYFDVLGVDPARGRAFTADEFAAPGAGPVARDVLFANYLVRTATPADRLVPTLERELRMLDPDLVFLDTGTLGDLAAVRTFPIRAGAWLIGLFGVLALLLAAVGLYGVIAFAVSRRVREIGVRKALGAEPGTVVAVVLRRGMLLVGIGGLIGAGLAVAGGSALGSVLYVGAFDPVSFAAAFGLLAAVAALAHWVPARRAARVDPMVALRGE